MRSVTAGPKKIKKATKNAEQLNTPVDRKENAKKRKKVSKEKPAKAEILQTFVYKDFGQHLSNAVKKDVNSHEPIRFVIDYGDRERRNKQWVQYMKPEIISRCLIAPKSRGIFCAKVFGFVLISLLITESIAVTTWVVPEVAVVLKGVIGLGLLIGSIFLFLLSFSVMCSPCSIESPWNMFCYFFLFAASSIISGVMVAHSGGAEVILAIAVLAAIIFLFLILAYNNVDFTEPFFYVMAVTLVLIFFSLGIYVISGVMRIKVTLIHMFVALTYSIFYVICVILQVQMILCAKGIELTKHDWLFGAATVFISIVFVFKNILQMIHQYNLI